jgi:hypothetical protein
VRSLLLLLAGLLIGCPSTDGSNSDDPALDVGTGEIEFEPLSDGDTMTMHIGSQGGYHLEVSARARGIVAGDARNLLDETNPTIEFGIDHNGTSMVLTDPFTQGIDDAPEDAAPWTHELLGREARIDIEFGEDDAWDGETVTLSMTVTDTEGTSIQDSVDVVLEPSPFDENLPG